MGSVQPQQAGHRTFFGDLSVFSERPQLPTTYGAGGHSHSPAHAYANRGNSIFETVPVRVIRQDDVRTGLARDVVEPFAPIGCKPRENRDPR